MLEVALVTGRRVLGSTHPTTLLTAEFLEIVRSNKLTNQPAKGRGKTVARRTERAAPAVAPLSPTAMAEAEAQAGAAEAELLAMLELEAAAAGSGTVRSESAPKGKAKGQQEKARLISKARVAPSQWGRDRSALGSWHATCTPYMLSALTANVALPLLADSGSGLTTKLSHSHVQLSGAPEFSCTD